MTCSRPSTRNRRTQRAATVRMSIIRTRRRTRPQKPKHLVDPTVSYAHSAASGGTLCLSCLQHAKPQSQHVQHFLVFPFQLPFCCHFNAANGQTTVKLKWLTSLTHTISLSSTLSHSLSSSLTILQIWPLGNTSCCCHYNCSHLAAGRIRLVCAHLAGHTSSRPAADFRG